MKKVDMRKIRVLKHIVEKYIETGEVLGSKTFLDQFDLGVSSATIRNDMASLEKMGLIFQPYNSAGRLPTDQWMRIFVNYLMDDMLGILLEEKSMEWTSQMREWVLDDILYDIISRLSRTTKEITFVTVPNEGILSYLGFSHIFEESTFRHKENLHAIVSLLEEKRRFFQLLENLPIHHKVSVFIGVDQLWEEFSDTAMIVKKIRLHGHEWYLGIIGSIRMDYAFNISTLRQLLSF